MAAQALLAGAPSASDAAAMAETMAETTAETDAKECTAASQLAAEMAETAETAEAVDEERQTAAEEGPKAVKVAGFESATTKVAARMVQAAPRTAENRTAPML